MEKIERGVKRKTAENKGVCTVGRAENRPDDRRGLVAVGAASDALPVRINNSLVCAGQNRQRKR